MKTFEECCEYLGIPTDLPKCYVREKQIQAAYKLSVCMKAWNKMDEFEPDETANYNQEGVGYTPYFHFRDGMLLASGSVEAGAATGIVYAVAYDEDSYTSAYIGLRLPLKTRDRAVKFSETFIEIFKELI